MQTFLLEIKSILNTSCVLESAEEKSYASCDQSTNVAPKVPWLVLQITDQEQLINAVRLCIKHRVPLVVRGAGTGKSGGAIPVENGVVIDVSRLNRIVSIDEQNLLAIVEPGLILNDFKTAVRACNLFYPPDPASYMSCTLGGNVAENAGGPSALKYGTTRDYFLGGQAITGTGEIIKFGKNCPKGVAGYDIASLMCGSEGTLAVFTHLSFRLLPITKSEAVGCYFFRDEESALLAVNQVLKSGHRPKALEYVDFICLSALSRVHGYSIDAKIKAALIIECDCHTEDGASKQLREIETYFSESLLTKPIYATSKKDQEQLWAMRSQLSNACSLYLGHKISEDIAVPLGRLLDFSLAVKKLEEPPHLLCGLFGHAGDGNLHVQIMYDDARLQEKAQLICHEVNLLALQYGGTITAEHGIGLKKKEYLPLEQSAILIDLQRQIKRVFDPYNLINPGKIFNI